YEVIVTANDGLNTTDQTITVTIEDVNDNRPVITSPNVFTVDENQLSAGTVTFTDADGGSDDPDWKAFFIRGGADKDSFDIGFKTGVITFKTSPDYETKSSYSITVNVSDGTLPETTQDITVNVNNKGDLLSVADISVNEETPAILTASLDAEAASDITFEYEITSGTAESGSDYGDSGSASGTVTIPEGSSSATFTIDTGVADNDDEENEYYIVTLSNASAPVTITDTTAQVTIIDNDSTVSVADASVNDGERAETTISIANISPLDVSVDWIASQEPGDTAQRGNDFSDSYYSGTAIIPAGSTSTTIGLETFVPDNLDEEDETFTITLRDPVNARIGDGTATITIIDDDESPVFTSSTSFTVDENQNSVDTVVASDADGDTVTYSILAGVDKDSFAIDSSSGALTFVNAPDYETKTSYEVTVTADDGNLNTTDQSITVTINDTNDNAPVFTSTATPEIDENTTDVVTLVTTDADTNPTVTYSITGGTDASLFKILDIPLDTLPISNTLSLRLLTAADFETKTSYEVTVTATDNDGVNSTPQNITVTVKDLNDEAPEFTSNAAVTIDENETAVTTLKTTDADADSTVSYSITGGVDKDSFTIVSEATGILKLTSAADFETKTSYEVTVTATDNDGINSTPQDITLTISDLNDEAPVFTSNAAVTIDENETAVTTLTTSDADAGSSVTYSITGGADAASFAVNETTGDLRLKAAANYESGKISYSVTVTATDNDGTNSTPQEFTLTINNVDEVPVFKTNGQYTADENQFAIGTATATDPEGGDITYTFGDGNSVIQVTSVSGILSFVTNHFEDGAPNYEGTGTYPFDGDYNTAVGCSGNNDDNYILIATDENGNATKQNICVQINNLNEAPVFTSSDTFSVTEGNTNVGTVEATDEDAGDTVGYSLSGTDADSFELGAATGALTFKTAPDYETKTSYSITAIATDGVNTTNQSIT
ncbi:cadherin domain-containing protein, partial [Gammaproteobacteria bacterium]|nr:cadherin domain-containing protein [Gammaproteobacteria bacterium]